MNQKQIKFRARLIQDGKPWMFYQESQYLISFLRRCTSFIAFDKDGEDGRHESYLPKPLEDYLDVFVGIRDKKGKEIYEGDVVNLVWGKESSNIDGGIENQIIIPCVFEKGIEGLHSWHHNWGDLIMRPLLTQAEFKIKTRGRENQFNPWGNAWEREVIGNIYENSELLTK